MEEEDIQDEGEKEEDGSEEQRMWQHSESQRGSSKYSTITSIPETAKVFLSIFNPRKVEPGGGGHPGSWKVGPGPGGSHSGS